MEIIHKLVHCCKGKWSAARRAHVVSTCEFIYSARTLMSAVQRKERSLTPVILQTRPPRRQLSNHRLISAFLYHHHDTGRKVEFVVRGQVHEELVKLLCNHPAYEGLCDWPQDALCLLSARKHRVDTVCLLLNIDSIWSNSCMADDFSVVCCCSCTILENFF